MPRLSTALLPAVSRLQGARPPVQAGHARRRARVGGRRGSGVATAMVDECRVGEASRGRRGRTWRRRGRRGRAWCRRGRRGRAWRRRGRRAARGAGRIDGAVRGAGRIDGAALGAGMIDVAARGAGGVDGAARGAEGVDGAARGAGNGTRLSHPTLRNKARCISYMRQEDNIYNNRVYRDECHKTSEYLLHSGSLITK
jgi:hypothetical protein